MCTVLFVLECSSYKRASSASACQLQLALQKTDSHQDGHVWPQCTQVSKQEQSSSTMV